MALAGALIAKVALEGIDGVTKGLQQMGKDMQATGKSVGKNSNSMAKTVSTSMGNMVKAIGLVKVAQWGLQTAMGQLNSAISRYDTLNNFPKVLHQMGYEAEDTDRAMAKLSEGISGLPTTLDGIAKNAQRMTISLKDIDYGTDLAIGLNNAFLASLATTEEATRGMEQFMSMLATGEVNLTSWRTLEQTMPYALNEIAQAFLGAEGDATQLYDAIKDGDITFDQFCKKIIEMDTATGGFAETAREATGGIGTSFANMRTAVTVGVVNIIEQVDLALESFGGIGGVISSVGKIFRGVLTDMADAIPHVVEALALMYSKLEEIGVVDAFKDIAVKAFEAVKQAIDWIIDNLDILIPLLAGLGTAVGVLKALTLAQKMLNAVMGLNPFVLVAIAVTGLVAALIVLWKTNEGFRDFIIGAFESIGNTIATVVSFIVDFVKDNWEILFVILTGGMGALVLLVVKNWDTIKDTTKALVDKLVEFWESFKEKVSTIITAVTEFFISVWESATEVFNAVWQGYVAIVTKCSDMVKAVVQASWDVIKTIFLIAIGIVITILAPLWNAFADGWNWVVDMATVFVAKVKTLISNLVDTLIGYWENFKNNVKAVWDFIKDNIITPVVEVIKTVVNSLLTHAKEVVEGIRTAFSVAWNFIKDNIVTPIIEIIKSIIEGIKETVQSVLDMVKTIWTTVFNAIKETVQGIIDSIKETINEISTTVSEVVDRVKNSFTTAFDAVKDIVASAVGTVIETIGGIWTSAKEVTEKIKDAFSNIFKSIKVPSFSMGGWTASDLPKMPKMSIQWNATGGFLDKATLIGAGEAGTEAIVPMTGKRKMAPFAKAITDNFDFGSRDSNISGETVTQHFNIAELVVREDADIHRIAQQLHKLQERNSSRNGVFR